MPAKGQILFNSSIVGSSSTLPMSWDGGRTNLTIDATNFATGVGLQVQNISGNWIPIASSFVSNQVFPFDAPPGQYKLAVGSGVATAVAATMTSTPYTG